MRVPTCRHLTVAGGRSDKWGRSAWSGGLFCQAFGLLPGILMSDTSPKDRVDLAIAGAGFAGLALAAVAVDVGLTVSLVERRQRLAPEGVGLVLQPNGLSCLDRLGVLPEILARGQRIDTVKQRDASGRIRAQASYGDLQHPQPYLVVIERTAAIEVLAARVPESVRVHVASDAKGLRVKNGEVRGMHCTDSSGNQRTIDAACVVGADGINSQIRQAMGSELRWRTAADRYLIGLSRCAPTDEAATLHCGNGWCNGVMPLGDRTYFFDHVTGESRVAVEKGDFKSWQKVYGERIPDGDRIAAGLDSFDEAGFLSGRTQMAVPRFRPGVALIGDAAAAVHPHNGQGANRALEDALSLGDELARHGPTLAALGRYGKARDAKARRAVPWSIFIGRTLDGPHIGWRAVRRGGYVASRVPFVRNQTTRRQAGLI